MVPRDVAALTADAEAEWIEGWLQGPTRLRWSALPPQVGDRAPDLALQDDAGATVRLSDLWAGGPAIVLFWRHFGCGCGIDRARRLREEIEGYREAGATVALVGQGEPPRAAAYRERYGIPVPILCDPDHRAYEAFGVLEGKPSQILFDAPEDLLRGDPEAGRRFAAQRREAGRPPVDSPWLLPAEFVVDREGVLRLAYRYQHCEDFPNPLVLRAAVLEAAGG